MRQSDTEHWALHTAHTAILHAAARFLKIKPAGSVAAIALILMLISKIIDNYNKKATQRGP